MLRLSNISIWEMFIFLKKKYLRHLKLEIALAIPALKMKEK